MTKPHRLPIVSLLALTLAGFIAIITETLPAGLLPQISNDIGVSEFFAGQFITAYALGAVIAAIPVINLTKNWNRKPLLLIAVSGFFVFNLTTFLSNNYAVLLVVRFLAGMSAGIIWGLLTGYAIRMVFSDLAGKALAIVGVGQPIALSLGVPLATWMGNIIGWSTIFLIISILSSILFVWIICLVPDFAVEKKTNSTPFKKVFTNKSVQKILLFTLLWILAHNLLYTYITPFLEQNNLSENVEWILFLFGASSILGIWLTGLLIDNHLKKLMVIGLALFALAGIILLLGNILPIFVYMGVALWGFSFGSAPTLLQKDLADVAKENVDIAQAIFVTVFNLAVAGGGFFGGFLLKILGIISIIIALLFLTGLSLVLVFKTRI